jgi:hypothetical protein
MGGQEMEIQRLMLERKSNKIWELMVTLFVGNAEKVPRKLKENWDENPLENPCS